MKRAQEIEDKITKARENYDRVKSVADGIDAKIESMLLEVDSSDKQVVSLQGTRRKAADEMDLIARQISGFEKQLPDAQRKDARQRCGELSLAIGKARKRVDESREKLLAAIAELETLATEHYEAAAQWENLKAEATHWAKQAGSAPERFERPEVLTHPAFVRLDSLKRMSVEHHTKIFEFQPERRDDAA